MKKIINILFSLVFLIKGILSNSSMVLEYLTKLDLDSHFSDENLPFYLDITGISSVSLESDIIILGIKIESLSLSLAESYKINTNSSNSASHIFEKYKIPDKNLTTIKYIMEEKYRDVETKDIKDEGQMKIFEGYKITNEIEIKLTNMKLIPYLIDEFIRIGKILITQIKFDYSEKERKITLDQLMIDAAQDAFYRAKKTSQMFGMKIVDVKTIQKPELFIPRPVVRERETSRKLLIGYAAGSVAPPQIYSGRDNVESKLFVKFIMDK